MNMGRKFIMFAILVMSVYSTGFASTWHVTFVNNMSWYNLGIKSAGSDCWSEGSGDVVLEPGASSRVWVSASRASTPFDACTARENYQRGVGIYVISGNNVWTYVGEITLNEHWDGGTETAWIGYTHNGEHEQIPRPINVDGDTVLNTITFTNTGIGDTHPTMSVQ